VSERSLHSVGLVRAVAACVSSLPGVACLTGGPGVEAATYYRGGKVVGVVVRDGRMSVHLVANALPIQKVVADVREAITGFLRDQDHGFAVEIVVEDLEVDQLPAEESFSDAESLEKPLGR
jgi:hypothetical protein